MLTRGRHDLKEVYWVGFAPAHDETSDREVRFAFARQADAEEFARSVGDFIHAEVVTKLTQPRDS